MSKVKKGVISPAIREMLAVWLDEKIYVGKVLEPFDKMIFKVLINQIDDRFGDNIPEPYKSKIEETLILIFEEKDLNEAVIRAFTFLDELVDIPFFDDESERLIFEGLATLVAGILAKLNIVKE